MQSHEAIASTGLLDSDLLLRLAVWSHCQGNDHAHNGPGRTGIPRVAPLVSLQLRARKSAHTERRRGTRAGNAARRGRGTGYVPARIEAADLADGHPQAQDHRLAPQRGTQPRARELTPRVGLG